jgi:hypothetical protein
MEVTSFTRDRISSVSKEAFTKAIAPLLLATYSITSLSEFNFTGGGSLF